MIIRRSLILTLTCALLAAAPAAGPQQARAAGQPAAPIAVAAIEGIVTSMDAPPQPLRRAIVTVSGSGLPTPRSVVTDDEGRFAIRGVPVGRVTVAASKRGYVTGAYGASRPGRVGVPAEITIGQTFSAAIRLARASVLAGTIRDERGRPLSGVRVFALDAVDPVAPTSGLLRSTSLPADVGVLTDDRGMYRIYDLVPRAYIIAAVTSGLVGDIARRTAADTDALIASLRGRGAGARGSAPAANSASSRSPVLGALVPVFFPGTISSATAQALTLAPGDVRTGLDFTIPIVPVTTIEGTVVGAGGAPAESVQLSITPVGTVQFLSLGGGAPRVVQSPGPDGRFLYSSIVPGRYTITARTGRAATAFGGRETGAAPAAAGEAGRGRGAATNAEVLYGQEEIEVTSSPVSGLTIRLQPGGRFSGRVEFDSASGSIPTDLTQVGILLQAFRDNRASTIRGTSIGNAFGMIVPGVSPRADGTFEVQGLAPGRYRATVVLPPADRARWWLEDGIVGGKDMLDAGLLVGPGTNATGAVLTITDRHTELSGTLVSSGPLAAQDCFIIVMPVDPAMREAGSRRVRSTRPATDGRFTIANLPSGDYLVAAVTDADPNEWQRPDFLADVAPGGVRVTIARGERKVLDLKIQ